MRFQLMTLQIHLRVEDDKLLLQALGVETRKVILAKVLLKRIVVLEILWISSACPPIAKMASLMSIATMCIEFVISVESLPAESALGMTFKPTLIHSSRNVVAILLMLPQLLLREYLVLVDKHLFVSSAQIAHHLVMYALHMTMEIRPAQARRITGRIWTVVPEQDYRILENLLLFICNPKIAVLPTEVAILKLFVSLLLLICEYHRSCLSPTMCTGFSLIQSSEP